MGNCIRSQLRFCAPCIGRDAPIAPACNEVVANAAISPHLSKDQCIPVLQPDHDSLRRQLDRILMEQGGVYYLPPPPVEPCSPPVARRSKPGQSIKILVSRQQLELLVQGQEFNERVMQFMTELGATDDQESNLFQKWKPDLPTIPEY